MDFIQAGSTSSSLTVILLPSSSFSAFPFPGVLQSELPLLGHLPLHQKL